MEQVSFGTNINVSDEVKALFNYARNEIKEVKKVTRFIEKAKKDGIPYDMEIKTDELHGNRFLSGTITNPETINSHYKYAYSGKNNGLETDPSRLDKLVTRFPILQVIRKPSIKNNAMGLDRPFERIKQIYKNMLGIHKDQTRFEAYRAKEAQREAKVKELWG
ncbi:MAG: hypothetical protein A2Y25_02745 [Candidatus Melainabacteria bacterium GWF2_37_15]|nr:MAG: hypothetical protein A2Y25_02745 [Candidatus Melainabacteria bacterium GWF2_37_15]